MIPGSGKFSSGPMAYPNFRRVWFGGMVSNLGTMVQTVGAGWLMATIAASDTMVALVQSATTLPILLFSLPAGAIADSYDRRRVLIVAQLLMMVSAIALAVTASAGLATPLLLLAFTFLIGCGTALHTPSWQALVGDVVPRDQIPAAVSFNSVAINLTRSIGPAMGGVVVALAGAAAAFAVNAVSFLPMIHAIMRIRPDEARATLPREWLGHAIFSGLRYAAMSPNLLYVMFRGLLFGFSAVIILALMPLVARDLLQGSAVTFGLLLAAFGIGAIAAAGANGAMRKRYTSETILRGAFAGTAVSAALTACSGQVWLTMLFLVPAGACWVLALSLQNVLVQLSTPRWVVGRILALYQMASFGGMTAGAWLWGVIAEAHGLGTALLLAAVTGIAGALVGLKLPLPQMETANLDPLNRFREPELRLQLTPRSGPIMVMVEYDVTQENVQAFLDAMTQRRRMRLRDGARNWVLMRDLEHPSLWTETYHVPTWVEYLRHNLRRTNADAVISERLNALNSHGNPPRVKRWIERPTVPQHDDMVLKPPQHIP